MTKLVSVKIFKIIYFCFVIHQNNDVFKLNFANISKNLLSEIKHLRIVIPSFQKSIIFLENFLIILIGPMSILTHFIYDAQKRKTQFFDLLIKIHGGPIRSRQFIDLLLKLNKQRVVNFLALIFIILNSLLLFST